MRRIPGNELNLGMVDGKGIPLKMTPQMRSTHLYICGSTGTGKSKMLESLVRQDIKNWPKSKCGALIIDPHGSLYNSLINWIAWNEPYLKDVPIVPIDLRQNDWTIAYNVMRPRPVADSSVVVSNFVQAMALCLGRGRHGQNSALRTAGKARPRGGVREKNVAPRSEVPD